MAFLRDSHTKWGVGMTEYRGKRIDELLSEIEILTQVLDSFAFEDFDVEHQQKLTHAQMLLAINKAKLTALQGENNAS